MDDEKDNTSKKPKGNTHDTTSAPPPTNTLLPVTHSLLCVCCAAQTLTFSSSG